MHCQSYFFILSLLILSLSRLVKSEDNPFNSSIEKAPDKPVLDDLNKSTDLATETVAASPSFSDKPPNVTSDSNKNTQSGELAPASSDDQPFSSSNSSDSRARGLLEFFFSPQLPTTAQPDTSTDSEPAATTSSSTTTELPDLPVDLPNSEKDEIKQHDSRHCVFFMLAGEQETRIEPNSTLSNYFSDQCFRSERLNLTKEEAQFEDTPSTVNKESLYALPDFVDEHYENVLQLRLQRTATDAFRLLLAWSKVNATTAHKNYGILLTIYEDLESIGKLFITDKLAANKSKRVEFYHLNNVTYSISLSLVDYFSDDSKVYLQSHKQDYESPDKPVYLIKNVYRQMQDGLPDPAPNNQLNSTSQIAIYTIASLLLLGLVCGLLYMRRNKFKTLINHHLDKAATHQNSKYLRPRKDTPAINVLHYDNSANGQSSFEHQFMKNTAQLNCQDRTSGGFNFRNVANNGREKLSLSKSGLGRVLNHSVATIKKRTAMKSINPSSVEFDLSRISSSSSSKYSHSIPLIDFLPLLHELTKTNSQKLFNEFMQLNILSNGSNTIKKTSKVGRNSKNIQLNKDGIVIPYDHSRIVLEVNKYLTSNYINASSIPGLNYGDEYIACQSPLKSTTYSFWLMCLQQNVKYIVMTVPLIESSSFTTDKYWPDMISEDGESMKQIENITIKLKDKRQYQYFTIRIFEVKMSDETRVIKHYQLTDWNEIENAQNVHMITSFIEMFREEIGCEETVLNDSPIVVHCSNGVGKTAIFIAIDRIYVQLKKGKSDYIDIFKTVIEMRQYRPLMVQNEAQYRFIYECVGQLVSKLYPSLVKQAEFDRSLDEINLNEKTDFDANNNLGNSFNSQLSLMSILKSSANGRPGDGRQLNGYTNHTFLGDSTNSLSQRSVL